MVRTAPPAYTQLVNIVSHAAASRSGVNLSCAVMRFIRGFCGRTLTSGCVAHAEGGEGGAAGGRRRRGPAAQTDPSSTLEASWEALNVKKFDLAFAVDPLFHKTSAQFDAGGASGADPCPPPPPLTADTGQRWGAVGSQC